MVSFFKQLSIHTKSSSQILDKGIPIDQYCLLNLSDSNVELHNVEISNPITCQSHIDIVLHRNQAMIAWGGYLEKRNLYDDKASFSKPTLKRNIHLGIDFWAKAGTKVIVPLKGNVHSFQNNTTIGDYGPTIILQHEFEGIQFHTLYGHLSEASIEIITIGQVFEAGDTIATLGSSDINVNYAPHLHFQIIIDMEGNRGDYPGVCSEDSLPFYVKNCPDPNLLLQIST